MEGIADPDNRVRRHDMRGELLPMLSRWVFEHMMIVAKNFARFGFGDGRNVVSI
jgi:hypothetical protein